MTLGEDTYATLAEFKAWCEKRLINYYDFNDLQIQGALITVSLDFIEVNYTFAGKKLDDDQSLQLPTDKVAISDIASAVCQATLMHLNGELFVTADTSVNGEVTRKREKVGPIEEETEYSEGSAPGYTFNTTRIDRLIKKFTISGAGGLGLLRG